MKAANVLQFERSLLQPAVGTFDGDELAVLPEPVRRMFLAAIEPDTPLATAARITMRGRIKLKFWMRFTASEVVAPLAGFVWTARSGPLAGYDRYTGGEGEMRWRLLGLIPLIHAVGSDIDRGAAARAAAESAWVPTALLPRFGAEWSANDQQHLSARIRLDPGREFTVNFRLDGQGRISAVWLDRWGDPDGSGAPGLHPFGMEAGAHRNFEGVTIPSAGRAGWHFGTDRWPEAAFFEYEITSLELVSADKP